MIKRKKNLFLRLHQNTRFQKFESVLLPLLLGVLLLILWQTQARFFTRIRSPFPCPLESSPSSATTFRLSGKISRRLCWWRWRDWQSAPCWVI